MGNKVGKNFGCYAVHEKQRFTYFYIAHIAFMVSSMMCSLVFSISFSAVSRKHFNQ